MVYMEDSICISIASGSLHEEAGKFTGWLLKVELIKGQKAPLCL